MCGVPYHAAENYIYRLIQKGYRVAICEQLEDPKTARGLVKRGVIKVITPGTILYENAIADKSNNYLIYIHEEGRNLAAAMADVSTGECWWGLWDSRKEKGDFFEGLKEVKDELQRYLEDHESVGEYALIKHAIEKLNKPGVTVGTLGGGMALAYQANNGASDFQTTSKAESYVSKVGINVKSGYNVGIFGSGLAAGSAASIGEDTLNAVSTVGSSTITLSGGETIGVMGGGISYFTGTSEP